MDKKQDLSKLTLDEKEEVALDYFGDREKYFESLLNFVIADILAKEEELQVLKQLEEDENFHKDFYYHLTKTDPTLIYDGLNRGIDVNSVRNLQNNQNTNIQAEDTD